MNPLLVPAWLASAALDPTALAPDEVDAVELPWTSYQALRELGEDHEPPALGPWVAEREAELRPVEGGWELRVRWSLEVQTPGWLWQPLLGPGIELSSATWDGRRAPVVSLPGGTHLAAFVEHAGELELRAFVPGSLDQPIDLALMPATRGRLTVSVPGRVPVPVVETDGAEAPPVLDGGIVWSGARRVALELRDPDRAPPTRETLAVAHAGVGLTVGDAELRGRAHLQWELRHGSLERVRATVAGLGDDLTVEGSNIAGWSRDGDALEFQLSSPASGRVDLELRWSQAVPAGDEASLSLPRIEPEAWRSELSLQVARDGEVEVIPRADEWSAIAAAELPEWGQGLVEGTPTAAYRHSASSPGGSLELLRFVPVPGPPTVVDVASYTMATTEEGRVLMRAHYELRNDRGAHLTVRPPPGLTIIGARVAGETALPSRGEGGAWRLPLKRSLETVDGLLSFPVEVILLGEQDPWERREHRELPLPTLDAPIAASHVTLHLPPRYRSRLEAGEHNVVEEFGEGEGLTYGLGVGEVGSAAADALFQEAVEGYLSNDFEEAQAKLEQLEQLGVRNENMSRLQSNIDVIEGRSDSGEGDVALQRRVKEQARARAAEQFRQQESLIEEAERAASAGDYAQAEAQYQAAIELGGELAKLEQSESVEQDKKNADIEVELETISKKKSKKGKKDENRGVLQTKFKSSLPASSEPSDDPAQSFAKIRANVPPELEQPPEPPPPEEPVVATGAPGKHMLVDEPPPVEEEIAMPVEPEPEPMPEPTAMADMDEPYYEEADRIMLAPARRRGRFRRGGRVRYKRSFGGGKGGGALEGEPIVRNKNMRGHRSRGPAATEGVSVYDFEDDNIDGEILSPEGANLSSRASAQHAAVVSTPNGMTVPDTSVDGSGSAASDDGILLEDATGVALGTEVADQPNALLDALPAPQVNASALSVVIPAAGEAVRYEQLLIEANQTQTITIDARRRLRLR
ncbi:MAG: hypothetical protein H6712_14685 [Myxococcales bacterium]|nr:hypothetical protein [Myxococcales bacterium]